MAQSQYATIAQLKQFSIPETAAKFFGGTAMDAALQAASSIADSYLAGQFKLPLSVSPQGWDLSLTIAVCNLAVYLLYNQFGYSSDQPGDELAKRRYDDAMSWLTKVSDSELSPQFVDSSGNTPGGDPSGDFVVSDPPVGFTGRGSSIDGTSIDPWGWKA